MKKPLVKFDRQGMHTDSPVIYYGAFILVFEILYVITHYGIFPFCKWLYLLYFNFQEN